MSVRGRIVLLLAAVLLFARAGQAGESRLEQRVYAVSDLVVAATNEDRLIKVITDTIAPRSWAEKGGRGTIDYHPLTAALIVNQSPDVQDQIGDLLAALRRAHDKEIAVEVKYVLITGEVVRDLQQKGILGKWDAEKNGRGDVVFLNDAQMARFIEMTQSDIHTNVMQAPKMTMFNGQRAGFDCRHKQQFATGMEIVAHGDRIEYRPKTETVPLGVRLGMCPVVSADRRSVRLDLDTSITNVDSKDVPKFPITTPAPGAPVDPDGKPRTVTHYIERPHISKVVVKRTLTIPDGHTAVMQASSKKMMAVRRHGPPVLSDIPVVGNLLCTFECHEMTQHLLVMVTPRILVAAEEEEKKTQAEPCPMMRECSKPASLPSWVEEKLKSESRTPTIPPVITSDAASIAEPTEAAILRALPQTVRVPGFLEESRDDIQIVTERIVDKTDPPRFFPLIGPAQLHHCHWKCTVYYRETLTSAYPFAFRSTAPRIHVVYLDSDQLQMVDSAKGN